MSDGAQVLGLAVTGKEASASAARVLAWLAERGVVEALPTDSGLGSGLAHRPGPRALDWVEPQKPSVLDFRKLTVNGVELSYTPQAQLLFADEMPDFACPGCGAETDADVVMKRLGERDNPFLAPPARQSSHIVCASCGKSCELNELAVKHGAFANVVLRFWNWWPLKRELIAELRQIAGSDGVAVFYERI